MAINFSTFMKFFELHRYLEPYWERKHRELAYMLDWIYMHNNIMDLKYGEDTSYEIISLKRLLI